MQEQLQQSEFVYSFELVDVLNMRQLQHDIVVVADGYLFFDCADALQKPLLHLTIVYLWHFYFLAVFQTLVRSASRQ
jgi:hypothetical protein